MAEQTLKEVLELYVPQYSLSEADFGLSLLLRDFGGVALSKKRINLVWIYVSEETCVTF